MKIVLFQEHRRYQRWVIRSWIIKSLFLYLSALFVARGGAPGNLDQVTLQLKWKHQFQFAGYYAAIAKGYYREAGLEVTLREAMPGHDPVEAVVNGEAEFGVGTSELMLLRAKRKEVVVLGVIFQHSPLVLLARRDDKTHDLHDLANRPVMIEPQSAEMFAYFKAEGMETSQLKIEHHTFSVDDIIQGRVAAMSAYSTDEPFQLQKAGVDFLTFTPRSGGIDFYGDNLFTVADQIRRHPERVRAFRAASMRGWDYALAHPEEIVDLILRDYSQRKTREHLLFEARNTALLMHPELIEVGHMNPGRWRHIADTYAEFGMVPRGFGLEGFLYNPNPKADTRWIIWVLGGVGLVMAGTLAWALPIYRLNHRLRLEASGRRAAERELALANQRAEGAGRKGHLCLEMMAGELRPPLEELSAMMRLIGAETLSQAQKHHLKLAEDSTEDLLRLIGDAMDYSRLTGSRVEVKEEQVNVRALTSGVCELFRGLAEAKGVGLSREVSSNVPPVIFTDPARLRQLLANLLSNAVKHAHSGRVELRVETPAGFATSNEVRVRPFRFSIIDSGGGLSIETLNAMLKAVQEPHLQPGIGGFGLAISQLLAQLLGGNIVVEKGPGQGVTLTVEILARTRESA